MRSITELAKQLSCTLIPSYLRRPEPETTRRISNRPKYATSALDGLRGIAALFVFFFHILFAYSNLVEYGYGQSAQQTRLAQLPIVRIVYSGHAMVIIFFVVGGYVFSLKPLKLMRNGQQTAALQALVSSVFKRGIRLYAPAVIATFGTMLTLYAGLWEYQRQYMKTDGSIILYADHHIERQSSVTAQLTHWLSETLRLTNFMTYFPKGITFEHYPQYDPHLWTIPIEYRSSLFLSVLLLAVSSCKTVPRLGLLATATIFAVAWDRWELVCFLAGATLCEIDLATGAFASGNKQPRGDTDTSDIQDKDEESMPLQDPDTKASIRRALGTQIPQLVTCMLGIYLLCAPPQDMLHTPGYSLVSHLTPPTYTDPKRWPHTIGTLLLVAALGRSSTIRKPFETTFAQYLGKISFSLYIVHGPLIHIVGFAVTPWIWTHVTGMQSDLQWSIGLLLGSIVLTVVVAVVADWFWRVVEGASIGWAQALQSWCFIERGEERHCGSIV